MKAVVTRRGFMDAGCDSDPLEFSGAVSLYCPMCGSEPRAALCFGAAMPGAQSAVPPGAPPSLG